MHHNLSGFKQEKKIICSFIVLDLEVQNKIVKWPFSLKALGDYLSLPFSSFLTLPVEKEMATHSSVLACRIPGMGEPGGLPSMGSHRVGHDWSDLAAAAEVARNHWYSLVCRCISPISAFVLTQHYFCMNQYFSVLMKTLVFGLGITIIQYDVILTWLHLK